MTIIQVALDIPLDRCFDYHASDATREDIGRRVLVPFGGRQLVGVIVALATATSVPNEKLKPAKKIYRDAPALDAHLLAVFGFCRDYYQHPLGQVVLNALPPGLRRAKPVFGKTLSVVRLTDKGRGLDPATLGKRSLRRHRLIAALQINGALSRIEIAEVCPRASPLINELVAAGLATVHELPPALAGANGLPPGARPELTEQQARALSSVEDGLGRFGVTLLHGVTGSGKTEVYLRLIETALSRNLQALILVPEINLTPQLEAVFRARFPAVALASLHSHLPQGERVGGYLAAQAGTALVVLGTRLAVFTPMPRLGLIIVDEEHDASFKQQEGLRYSARDVAIYRARELAIPVVLGSATPSLETFQNALAGRYRTAQLSQRAVPEAALPRVRLIASGREQRDGVTAPVLDALRANLRRREQSLVFINRRGYAPVLLCPQCHWASGCPRCSARLTLHAADKRLHAAGSRLHAAGSRLHAAGNRLRCHHCGLEAPAPRQCPNCGNVGLAAVGQGTQRLEEWLTGELPGARIVRVDRDAMASRTALTAFVERMGRGEMDILVGTQMLAKGHDFPRLTLVAVINADASLYSSDFRAEERLFAQLLQVSGRAGRGRLAGEVLVQTAFPEHPLFAALQRHDYAAFAHAQLALRRESRFPPFVFQALLRVESVVDETARTFTEEAARIAKTGATRVKVFDAVPAPLARLGGRARWQLLVQSNWRTPLQNFLRQWRSALEARPARDVRWAIDVDPTEV